jgi:hypothetical protein
MFLYSALEHTAWKTKTHVGNGHRVSEKSVFIVVAAEDKGFGGPMPYMYLVNIDHIGWNWYSDQKWTLVERVGT